jgi:hypothetical protein
MSGLGTKPRRLAPATFSRDGAAQAGLILWSGLFISREEISGGTHALQNFLKSHSYQNFQVHMGHYSTSSGKPYCNVCSVALCREAYIDTAVAFALQASLCCLDFVCCLKSFEYSTCAPQVLTRHFRMLNISRCAVGYHPMCSSTVTISEPTETSYSSRWFGKQSKLARCQYPHELAPRNLDQIPILYGLWQHFPRIRIYEVHSL